MRSKSFFLTAGGEPRKSLMTKSTAARHPDLDTALTRAQGRFVALDAERRALIAADATIALLRLADVARTDYAARKARRAALDYEDLIVKAAALLTGQGDDPAGAAQWVLYKLDEGLDHILVDEAQDTSPTQWRVIRGLAEEFFADSAGHSGTAPHGVRGRRREAIDLRVPGRGAAHARRKRHPLRGPRPRRLARLERRLAHALVPHDDARPRRRRRGLRRSRVARPASRASWAHCVTNPPARAMPASSRSGKRNCSRPAIDADTFMPTDERTAPSTAVRLAGRIADTIKHWLQTKARLESEDRPIRAGDILILVRRRASFAPAMIAALKQRDIPVSGADRMQLDGQIAVQDLIAVGDVLLLPEDDLALACVLKSPLIGLDDDDLLRVAPNRPGALWSALLEAARKGDARLATAAETIKRWRKRADFMPPFEFYAELLDADGGRAKLLARLGAEAADAIDEFLNLALVYDEDAPPSLQGFLDSLRQRQRVIKRDLEHGGNQVRVMTVHGAKGLEAPIVFLPDTCSSRSGGAQGGLVTLANANPLPSRTGAAPRRMAGQRDGGRRRHRQREKQEQARGER